MMGNDEMIHEDRQVGAEPDKPLSIARMYFDQFKGRI
jgi:hypothetical protein